MAKFLLSDESINSYGFKVKTAGIDLSGFENNPVMLYEHDRRSLIGSWKGLSKDGEKLLAEPDFDEGDELSDKVSRRVDKGILKGASIGIQILQFGEEVTDEGAVVPVVLKSKLIEASITALPSNSNALKLYDLSGEPMSEDAIKLSIDQAKNEFRNQNQNTMNLSQENLEALSLAAEHTEQQLNSAIDRMRQELSSLKQEKVTALKDQAKQLADQAVKEGKLLAENKESFLKLAENDLENARKMLEGISKPPKPTEQMNREKTGERKEWTLSDWRKKDMAGLHKLKQEQPEEYQELLKKSNVSKHIQ